MKTLPAIITASLLVASFGASAQVRTGSEVLSTQVAPTKEAAYQMGVEKLAQLKTISPRQLSMALRTPLGNIEDNSVRLNDGGYVTIQERMDANGQLGYVGQVNVGFGYVEHNSDN